jgi:UDP-N-acetylmuramoylalanine--D-glutamate ligase
VDAARCAVRSFAGGLHLILGGRDKGGDWEGLRGDLAGRVETIYLLGEAAGLIAGALEGVAPMRTCDSLEEAVQAAWAAAGPGATILLAPGCASQDMFRDYAERGERFAAAARGLAGAPAGSVR